MVRYSTASARYSLGEEEVNQGAIKASLERLEFESSNRIDQENARANLMQQSIVVCHERINMMRIEPTNRTLNEVVCQLEAGLYPAIARTTSVLETREEVARIFPRMAPIFYSGQANELCEINEELRNLTRQSAQLHARRIEILRLLRNNPMSRGPIDFSQPIPYAPESFSSEEEKELAEQFSELLHGPAPPYVTPPAQATPAEVNPPPLSLDLGPSLMG